MKYVFRSENGCCPKCTAFGRVYYIQDRYLGGEKYEYALMSKPAKNQESKHFKDKNEMVGSLLGIVTTDDIAVNLYLNQMTVYQCGNLRMLERNGKKLIYDDTKKELREYTEPKQETGFCDGYLVCLIMAIEFLKKNEQESSGMQVSLFD